MHDYKALQSRIRKDIPNGEKSLVIFRRQYLQRLPLSQIQWPTPELLRDYEVQQWIFEMLPKLSEVNHTLPEEDILENRQNNELRVSKWRKDLWAQLLKRIECAVQGTEEPDIFDPLMEECAKLQQTRMLPDAEGAEQDVLVTYEIGGIDIVLESQTISILERPRLLAGASCTGHRTWEAALAFGTDLVMSWLPAEKLKDKSVLELGAGTGLLSFLCAASDSCVPRRVIATDGSEEVVDRLHLNRERNSSSLNSCLKFGVYKWGESFEDCIIGDEMAVQQFDFVLAADVTYNPQLIPSLVWTIAELFKRNKHMICVLSATVRNEETVYVFLRECQTHSLRTTIVDPGQAEQTFLFHTYQDSIRFVHLSPA